MVKWICFGLGFVLCLAFVEVGEVQWADATNRLNAADLSVTNHPDLFKWNWKQHLIPKSKTVAEKQEPAPIPEDKDLTVRTYGKGMPIPFNELDNSLAQRIFFDYDRYEIKSESAGWIKINSAWMEKHSNYDILLEGHCDERGSAEYNLALGERRAEAVKERMIELGISADRISIRSWGEEKPLDLRQNESAYALNRRVEFYAIPK